MRLLSGWLVAGLSAALLAGCGDSAEEYPEPDEVPVTVPEPAPPGMTSTGVDTLLDPVTSPPFPGVTPP